MAAPHLSSGCRGYFVSPWVDRSSGGSDVSDCWLYHKEDVHIQALTSTIAGEREAALRRLIGAFNRKQMGGFVMGRGQALVRAIADILERKDATPTELTLACRTVCHLVLIMAEDIGLGLPTLIKETSPLLRNQAQGRDCRPACVALKTLAILAICGMHTGDLDIEAEDSGLLDWLWSIGLHKHADTAVAASSLFSWTVLLTTLAPHRIAQHRERRGPHLISLTRSEETSQAVRVAAEDALALFSECAGQGTSELDAAAPSGGNSTASKLHPTQYILPLGSVVYIRTQSHRVQFNFFQQVLGAGLDLHLQHNRLLHHIFEFIQERQTHEVPAAQLKDRHLKDPRPVTLRKDRSACRRSNQRIERAQGIVRNNGRAIKESMCFYDE